MDLRNSDSRRSSSSNSSTGVKSKWIKAFRSLKLTTVGGSSSNTEPFEDCNTKALFTLNKRNETPERQSHSSARFNAQLGVHAFQEYTYKKITACDVCREILRGHSRQGYKCKLCKVNVHPGTCQKNAPHCQRHETGHLISHFSLVVETFGQTLVSFSTLIKFKFKEYE